MIDVVLPVLDEAQSLPGVLAAMPSGFRALVVDNGSSDGSAEIAARAGARVVYEPRRGFGAACWAGLQAAQSEVVCFMDCDGSLDPRELPRVAAGVLEASSDLCLGARCPETSSWPLHARWANRALAWELRRRTGVRVHDVGPMRAARRAQLLELGLRDRAGGWPVEMVLRAAQQRWRIVEVPVAYYPRTGGRSKVTGSVRGSLRALRDMAAVLS